MLEFDIKDLLYLFWTLAWLVTIALILLSSWLCTWLSPGCFAGLFTWTSLPQVLLDTLLFWSCALFVSLAENYHLGVSFGQLFPFVVFEVENVLTVLNRRRTDSFFCVLDGFRERAVHLESWKPCWQPDLPSASLCGIDKPSIPFITYLQSRASYIFTPFS